MGDDKKKEIRPLKELSAYCRRYFPAILVSLLLGGAGAVFSVVGPDRIADMVNVIEQGLTGSMDLRRIGQIGVFLAMLYGLGGVFGYGQQYILTTVTQRMSKQLRTKIAEKINRMPLRYFDTNSFGDILSRLTNDVDTIGQMLGSGIGTLVSSVTLLIGALVMMFVTNGVLALSAIGASAIGFVLMIVMPGPLRSISWHSSRHWEKSMDILKRCFPVSRSSVHITGKHRPRITLTKSTGACMTARGNPGSCPG